MFNVGYQLRRFRRRSGLTLDQLAAASGVDRGTISRIELGHVSPRIETIGLLCQAMATDLARFFAPVETGPSPQPAPEVVPPIVGAPSAPAGYWPVPASFWQGMLEVVDRFEGLLRHSRELILVQDPAGFVLYASPACEGLLGQRGPDLVGQSFAALMHPDDRDRVQELLDILRAAPDSTGGLDFRLRHRDGAWRWVSAILGSHTGPTGVTALVLNGLLIPAPEPA
jgi:PAS domain S-box-containing protein